ncbi:MAG: bifunctional precorrin-2 dehydrogenase/sirohydrochlorin ferrochelatase [Acidimicrobiales bacterium]|nr:bifunctional precorrin-2 dehydrogenase/sirohydrochlorin ferrochelatase [Acidimicrobiales bacterium]
MTAPPPAPWLSARLQIHDRRCLVVGGGPVAARRARRLLDAGAAVTVVAPDLSESMRELPVDAVERPYRSGDLDDVVLVVTAAGSEAVDRRVVDDAVGAGILVNDATDPSRSTVVFPAEAVVGPVTVSVDTGGRSPAFASWLRRRIEDDLGDGIDEVVALLASARDELRAAGRPTEHPGWTAALDGGLIELVRDGRSDDARRLLHEALGMDRPGR